MLEIIGWILLGFTLGVVVVVLLINYLFNRSYGKMH